MPAGPPTKHTPDLLDKILDYIENHEKYKDVIPSIAGLAFHLGISRETLHTWKKQEGKEELSDMLCDLLAKQEKILMNSGLNGTFNSVITKLVLTKHGYSDKKELSGPDGQPIQNKWTVEIIKPKDEGEKPA